MRTRLLFVPSGDHQLATSVDLPPTAEINRRLPTVLVIHGLTGQRLGRSYHLVELGRLLASRGIACVRFDQAGCGESTGDFHDLTIPRMVDDSHAIHQWLREQQWCDTTRLGIVALSLGALAGVALDAAKPVRALALWGPVYDMPRVFGATTRTGLNAVLDEQGWVPYRGLRVGRGFVEHLDAVQPAELLRAGSAPLLIIHAEDDETVNVEEGRAYAERCRRIDRLCQLVTPAQGGHDFFEFNDRRKLLDTTVDFLARQLIAPK